MCVYVLGLGAQGLHDAWEEEWMLQTQEVGVTSHSATRSISFFLPAAAHLALFSCRGEGHVLPEQLPAGSGSTHICQHRLDCEWMGSDLKVFWMLTRLSQ